MKTMFCSFLLAAVCSLAPETGAQVSVGVYASGVRGHGYSAARVWVPGRYETVFDRAWVPAWSERIWVEPIYESRPVYRVGACQTRVLVRAGHWRSIHHPGRFELRERRVYRPGHWAPRGCR